VQRFWIHQKYLNLCSEQKPYRVELTL